MWFKAGVRAGRLASSAVALGTCCGYAMRGVIRTQERPSCELWSCVPRIRASTCVMGRGVARVCVCWEGGGPILRGGEPGEDTGTSRPAPPFTPHAGAPAPPTPAVCSLGVKPVGAARVRSGRGDWARPGAGARPWRSCASGVQCMAQLAVRLPRPPLLHIAACVCVRSRARG